MTTRGSKSGSRKPRSSTARLNTSTKTGNRLYEQSRARSRSNGTLGAASEISVPATAQTEAIDLDPASHVSQDVPLAEVQLLCTEYETQNFCLEDLERRLTSIDSTLELVQAEAAIPKAQEAH
ncbi:hypothetical protein BWQ96_07843 [Gracilariopsis chorda]|uniref:Uncharacterized protein n=1 Tax=Gracilariopsis chorda TaxID=448386 RepID=A0A2V3IK28_9FLOR|nr:hypothetical protein BWQ96_07843 [Gracilariopsis chorda]|eukprot:PXF42432.1 hypothetical protein BWQ96_07843 [Gracilariopsis chorda]